MDVFEIFKSAVKNVFASKLRTFLTMLGIVIGVAAVIAINGVGNGSVAQVEEQLNAMGPTLITLSLRSSSPRNLLTSDALTLDDYEYLRENLEGYYSGMTPVYSSSNASVTYLDDPTSAESITMMGVNADYEGISSINLLYGRYITEEEVDEYSKVIVVTDTFAESYFGYADESLIGEEVSVKTWKGRQKFTLVGIYENEDAETYAMYDGEIPEEVVIPITTAMRYFNTKTVSSIIIDAIDKEIVTDLTTLIDEMIHEYKGTTEKYRASNNLSILESANEVTGTMLVLISGVASISLVVAGIGIMNIMLVTVTERTREIGIRKSIGAKNMDILFQFVIEAVVITFTGGLLGLILGYVAGSIVGSFMGITCVISTSTALTSLFSASAIGLIFGVYPARKASLLDPIDALTRI